MRKLGFMICFGFTFFSLAEEQSPIKADFIFFGGDIFTLKESEITKPETLAIAQDKIIFSGSKKDALYLQKETTEWINLQNGALVPGFITLESNIFLNGLTYFSLDLSLERYKSMKDIIEALTQAAKKGPVLATGFSPYLIKKNKKLTLKKLDAISEKVPILVIDLNGSIAYANKKCLSNAGISYEMALSLPEDFKIKKNGKLSGEVISLEGISKLISPFENLLNLDFKKICEVSAKKFIRQGYTTTIDTTVGQFLPTPAKHQEMLSLAAKKSSLNIKGYYLANVFESLRDASQKATDFFEILGIHFDCDPPLLFQNKNGIIDEVMLKKATLASQNKLSISFKASSKAGIEKAFKCVNELQKLRPSSSKDFIIQHASLADENSLETIDFFHGSCSFSMQDIYTYGDTFRKLFPKSVFRELNMTKTALKQNLPFNITQSGVARALYSMKVLETAVLRESKKGLVVGREQRLRVIDGLKAMTSFAALSIKKEDQIGTLEVGKFADLVILKQSPANVAANKIGQIEISQTWIRGKKIANGSSD